MEIVDIHTHLLPGIDDTHLGRESFSHLMEVMRKAGVSEVVFTPHLYNPYVETHIDKIADTFSWAEKLALEKGIRTTLGCELFVREFVKPDFLPIYSRYVLCEFNTDFPPSTIWDTMDYIEGRGYRPIWAHIERYRWMCIGDATFLEAKERKILLQVNGEEILTDKAKAYLNAGVVDFIASDNHGDEGKVADFIRTLASYPDVYRKMSAFAQNK